MTIQEKITQIEEQLQQVVTEHNQLLEAKNQKQQQFVELQGALKVLQELDGDTDTQGEATWTSRYPSDVLQTAYSRGTII